MLPLGNDGEPLAMIAVSMDTRDARPARALGEHIDSERYTALTGQPLHGMFSAFKIAAGLDGWRRVVLSLRRRLSCRAMERRGGDRQNQCCPLWSL